MRFSDALSIVIPVQAPPLFFVIPAKVHCCLE